MEYVGPPDDPHAHERRYSIPLHSNFEGSLGYREGEWKGRVGGVRERAVWRRIVWEESRGRAAGN
jgi:hypothetical protein